MTLDDLPESLVVLNCCQCGGLMVRPPDARAWAPRGLLVLAARAGDRPYCRACWLHTPPPTFGGRGVFDPESSWQQNGVRALEDG